MQIVLASTSPYRRRLLDRLQLDFRCEPPAVDETALPGETARELAARLALAKARSVAQLAPESLVIGSDQAAELDGRILGKPGHHGAALAQLRTCSGREVIFHTGLALTWTSRGHEEVHVEPFSVTFRSLAAAQLDDYLRRDTPYDCAGSFKVEGLGIALFERLTGADPTSLEGLPLIALTGALGRLGLGPLKH